MRRVMGALSALWAATSAYCFDIGQMSACTRLNYSPAEARRCLQVPAMQAFADDEGMDGNAGDRNPPDEEMSDSAEEASEIADFRAAMMRQFLGGEEPGNEPNPVDRLLGVKDPTAPTVTMASALAAGQVLVANPERFCSRNPFARPVRDLGRFGLQGPIDDDELSPDMKAQMLPVLILMEHGKGGSRALLMERRTGALMGDVSMDDYGCVAISPLWLGGTVCPAHPPLCAPSVGSRAGTGTGTATAPARAEACPKLRLVPSCESPVLPLFPFVDTCVHPWLTVEPRPSRILCT